MGGNNAYGKKRIDVEVEFSLLENFNLRKGLEPLKALRDQFSITGAWEPGQSRRPYDIPEAHAQGQLVNNGEELAKQFLSLFTYRYSPNRTVPSAILLDESQAVADSIFGRMKGDQHAGGLPTALSDAAKRTLPDASSPSTNQGIAQWRDDGLPELLKIPGKL